ncbi:BSD domain-containing protein [Heracleum sosnowskyi]|uniref:BSD domain-containing protein n=1 Tax=Heracleum sosnowskyi TaxID=360622 RepID=A0AAD8M8K8_9APIA|nr:BSD domain-containing protein [Heracleum sosnowskyi]
MSSWFARTISNTLNLDESESESDPDQEDKTQNDVVKESQTDENSPPQSPNRSVKEDLSELTKTVTRQFWGVASFLAPPAASDSDPPSNDPEGSDIIPGIRSDFAEIGGRFRSGISKLSDNVASVSEITSKMASNFLQLGSDEEEERREGFDGVVGVTDAVLDFVADITMHPDTWLDFPLPDHENDQDFDMSDAQQEHALAVERLVPRLAALRMELCPGYMSDAWFWKVYFILLHPRLDLRDAEVLSTPQILEARALLTHNLKKPTNANPEQDWSSRGASYTKGSTNSQGEKQVSVSSVAEVESVPIETSACEPVDFPIVTVPETEKHPITSSEIVDKSVIEEGNVKQKKDQNSRSASASSIVETNDEDDADEWLKEESSGIASSKGTTVSIDNDDDVSFSDLEEDEADVPAS